jgi:hypothetical protein
VTGAGLVSGNLGTTLNNYFVSSIGASAFEGCASLTGIDLSTASATGSIGTRAFVSCAKLTIVKLPAGVDSIGELAFIDCASLVTLYWYHTSEPFSIGE